MNRDQIIQMTREEMEKFEDQYKMGGLSTGLYGDFACDIALQVAAAIRAVTKEEDAKIADNIEMKYSKIGEAIRASK